MLNAHYRIEFLLDKDMNTFKRIFIAFSNLLSVLFLNNCYSQGWEWQNPLPTGLEYTDAVLFDQNDILISCLTAALVYSRDGGQTWSIERTSGDSVIIVKMEKADNLLYVKSMMPKSMLLQYSTDRGKTFSKIKGFAGDSTTVLDFQVLATHVLLVLTKTRFNKFLSRTTDDGATWTNYLCPANSASNSGSFLHGEFAFRDSLFGIIPGPKTGPTTVYRTSDGGKSWVQSSQFPDLTDAHVRPLIWFNDTTVFAYSTKSPFQFLYRSTNAGLSWNASAVVKNGIGDIYFTSSSKIILTIEEGPQERINGSVDGGITWSLLYQNPNSNSNGVRAISFLDDQIGLVVGANGKIYKTSDGGITWDRMEKGFHAGWLDIHFMKEDRGIVCGVNQDSGNDGGAVALTTNGGELWEFKTVPLLSALSLSFPDDVNGFICGEANYYQGTNPLVMKTTDGGKSWASAYNWPGIDSSCRIGWEVFFVNKDEGWVAANFFLLYTSNAGKSWSNRYSSLPVIPKSYVKEVKFSDAFHGWIHGSSMIIQGVERLTTSFVLQTQNGGASWDTILTKVEHVDSRGIPTGFRIERIIFRKPNLLWILTTGGVTDSLFRSTNGGVSWSVFAVSFSLGYSSAIFFLDDRFGWANVNSQIGITTNGGETWMNNIGFTQLRNVDVSKSFFVSKDEGWVIGNGSAILHTTTGGINTVREQTALPTTVTLEQNYPNPFSSSTTIRFRISDLRFRNEKLQLSAQSEIDNLSTASLQLQSAIVFKVFDLFGREVLDLSEQSRKIHEVTVRNSQLPRSGVYFYQLRVGEQVKTKKMMMVVR